MMNVKQIAIVAGLVVVMGVAAAFGGYTVGVNAGKNQAANARSAFLADRGMGGNPPGMGGQGGTGFPGSTAGRQNGGSQLNVANFAMGQVKQVEGDTIQLSTANELKP